MNALNTAELSPDELSVPIRVPILRPRGDLGKATVRSEMGRDQAAADRLRPAKCNIEREGAMPPLLPLAQALLYPETCHTLALNHGDGVLFVVLVFASRERKMYQSPHPRFRC